MDWRINSVGLLMDSMSILWPQTLLQIGVDWETYGWNNGHVIAMAVMVFAGVVFAITGVARNGPISGLSAPVLMVVSASLAGYTLLVISSVTGDYIADQTVCDNSGALFRCHQASSIIPVVWLLWATLLTPALTIIGGSVLLHGHRARDIPNSHSSRNHDA